MGPTRPQQTFGGRVRGTGGQNVQVHTVLSSTAAKGINQTKNWMPKELLLSVCVLVMLGTVVACVSNECLVVMLFQPKSLSFKPGILKVKNTKMRSCRSWLLWFTHKHLILLDFQVTRPNLSGDYCEVKWCAGCLLMLHCFTHIFTLLYLLKL